MYMRLFLEGPPKSGTTRLLLGLLPDLRLRAGGCVLLPLREGDEARCVGLLDPGEAAASPMPWELFRDRAVSGPEGLHMAAFAELWAAGLKSAEEKGLALLDKIGGAELSVPALAAELDRLLDEEIPCVGVLCAREETVGLPAWENLRNKLAADEQTLLWNIDGQEESRTKEVVRRWAEEIDEWMRHRKFDPLERPRFRYAKRDRDGR